MTDDQLAGIRNAWVIAGFGPYDFERRMAQHDAEHRADTLRALRFKLREEDQTPWHVLDRIEELEFEAVQDADRIRESNGDDA